MKVAVVTGATSGIGLAICETFLHNNIRVFAIGRSMEKKVQLEQRFLQETKQGKLVIFLANMLEPEEIYHVSQEIQTLLDQDHHGHLDALINNVGCVRSWYTTNSYGEEQQFALNHLASFRLTHALLPSLLAAKGKVMMTSSKSHRHMNMHWRDLFFRHHYRPLMAYKQSKLANVLFAYELQQRYHSLGLQAYAIDPGLVNTAIGEKGTGGLVSWFWRQRRKHGVAPEVAAKTYLDLMSDTAHDGLYYYQSKAITYSKKVRASEAKKLFEISEGLCGFQFGGEQ